MFRGLRLMINLNFPDWVGNYKYVGVYSLTLLIWRDWDYDPLLCQIGNVLRKARSLEGVAWQVCEEKGWGEETGEILACNPP